MPLVVKSPLQSPLQQSWLTIITVHELISEQLIRKRSRGGRRDCAAQGSTIKIVTDCAKRKRLVFKQADDSDQVFDNTATFVLLTAWDMEFCDMQIMIMTIDILVVALSPSHPPALQKKS